MKLTQLKLAATSYVEDTTDYGKDVVKSYAIGAGCYAAAGIFFIAACLVGAGALFHYVAEAYGIYTAFAASGGILIFLAIVTAVIGATKMKPPAAKYTGLGSRLRTALIGKRAKPSPLPHDVIKASSARSKSVSRREADSRLSAVRPSRNPAESARLAAADVLHSSSYAPPTSTGTPAVTKAGAALAVTLLGWALARRLNTSGRIRV